MWCLPRCTGPRLRGEAVTWRWGAAPSAWSSRRNRCTSTCVRTGSPSPERRAAAWTPPLGWKTWGQSRWETTAVCSPGWNITPARWEGMGRTPSPSRYSVSDLTFRLFFFKARISDWCEFYYYYLFSNPVVPCSPNTIYLIIVSLLTVPGHESGWKINKIGIGCSMYLFIYLLYV